jgi:hypothetical protein
MTEKSAIGFSVSLNPDLNAYPFFFVGFFRGFPFGFGVFIAAWRACSNVSG